MVMIHHALLHIGNPTEVLKSLPLDVQKPGIDVRHIMLEQFGIHEARSLAHEASLRPVKEAGRTFVVAFLYATHEAQNALLKTLEEPASTSRFIIVVPHEEVLITTVRSRLSTQYDTTKVILEVTPEARDFLSQSYRDRLASITEHSKVKDVAWMEALLVGLEVWAHKTYNAVCMKELILVRRYFSMRGSSKKMLLEHLALTIP